MPQFISSEIYRKSTYGAWHPLAIPRVSTVMDLATALSWLEPGGWVRSPRARPRALSAWHSPDYIAAVLKAERDGHVSDEVRNRYNLGTHANPVFGAMYRRPATAAGAAVWAGEHLKDSGVLYSPAGGTHHGMPDHANGFFVISTTRFWRSFRCANTVCGASLMWTLMPIILTGLSMRLRQTPIRC